VWLPRSLKTPALAVGRAIKHRAENALRFATVGDMVGLELSASERVLCIERESVVRDLLFLAQGSGTREVKELFRGTGAALILARDEFSEAVSRADVVVAPSWLLPHREGTVRWYPFLDAGLHVASSLEGQLQRVRSNATRNRLAAVAADPQWTFRTSRSQADFDHFYESMYVPFLEHRFGERATIDAKHTLAQDFRNGAAVLLVSRNDGPPLAAALLVLRRDRTLCYHRIGFTDAAQTAEDEMSLRTSALEISVMRHAIAQENPTIDLGFAPAQLASGLLTHKHRLGSSFTPTPSSPTLSLWVRPSHRPELFGRAPLLTGLPAQWIVQVGCPRGVKHSESPLRAKVKHFGLAGVQRVVLSTDAAKDAPERVMFERVLAEELDGIRVVVDEVPSPNRG
jgi:hypothetical protein